MGQLTLSVRHEVDVRLLLVVFSELCYYLPKNQETLVDVNALFGLNPCRSSLALLFRTCQVDQLESTDRDVGLHLDILNLNSQRKDTVTSAGELVQVMGC